MWLLSTSHFELVHFNKPEDVVAGSSPDNKPGYAILSHVWARDGTEQSFANIERLFAQGITTYEDPRVSDKIRGCVRAAREHGFGWVWDDTCCIDKRSSAELEEAINSMFSWYAKAGICLAYLADVPDDCLPEDPNSAFRRSAWFKRGWTLQELVAPHCLIFLSENWRYLGTKVGLADLLQEITGIESDVLTFHRALQHVSVARRMSWASQRETSRVEDRAYSLLGIFDVSMATIYGEGANAFRRLQMEIMNRHPDHTLFAWGEMWAPGDNGSMSTMAPLNGRNGKTVPQNRSRPLKLGGRFTPPLSEKSNSPFASSPSDFQYAAMSPISLEDTVKRVREWLNITLSDSATAYEHLITSSGVRFQFIVVSGQPFSLAILLCQNDANQCVALPLWPQNEHRPQHYRVGAVKEGTLYRVFPICGTTLHSLRESGWRPQTDSDSAAVSIGRTPNHPNHRNRSCSPLTGSLRSVYIINTHASTLPHRAPRLHIEPRLLYIPAWTKQYLALHGLKLDGDPPFDQAVTPPPTLRVVHLHPDSPSPTPEFTIHLNHCGGKLYTYIQSPLNGTRTYAQATRQGPAGSLSQALWTSSPGPERLNAHVRGSPAIACQAAGPADPHVHVNSWENGSRDFVYGNRVVRLSATLWPTADSYCLEIKLRGEHYASLHYRATRSSQSPAAKLESVPPSPAEPLLYHPLAQPPLLPSADTSLGNVAYSTLDLIAPGFGTPQMLPYPLQLCEPQPFNPPALRAPRVYSGIPRHKSDESGPSRISRYPAPFIGPIAFEV